MKSKEFDGTRCEVWGRVVGYLRPTQTMNVGKVAEFDDREKFNFS